MGKRKKRYESGNPILDWVESLKLKELKRAAIMKGIDFRLLSELSVFQLQSWVYRHYHEKDDIPRLEEYDKWLEKTLMEEGAIDGPIHIDLKLGLYPEASDGTIKRKRRDFQLFGAKKTKSEEAYFKPQKGAMKAKVYDLVDQGFSTKEIIEQLKDQGYNIPSIKVWASKARKQKKLRENLEKK